MKISLNWQKKAIVTFAGIIIILSIILTTFAIREAQREKIIRERELKEDQRRASDLIIDQVKAIILETENRINDMLPAEIFQTQEIGFDEVCSRIMNEEEIVNEIFLIEQEGKVVFPHIKPIFALPGEELNRKKRAFAIETNDLFKSAETAEFRTKNYSLAIKDYQKLIDRISDKNSRAILLNCIGRCYIKAKKPSGAIKAYQQILKKYPSELSREGIPVAIIAQYQIGRICCDTNKKSLGIKALLELYKGLLESRWNLSKTQFHFYINQTETMLATSLADMDDQEEKRSLMKKWRELKQLEEERLRRAHARENIIQKVIPVLKTKKPSSGEAKRKFHHLSQKTEEEIYLISYTSIDAHTIFGVRLDSEALVEKLLPLNLERLPLRKDWHVQIADDAGNILAGKDVTQLKNPIPQLALSMDFEDDFPPWKVNIYQSDPDIVERQFHRRRNIYILSVVVVVAALFLGGFLAIRSTAKELELAKLKSEFVSTVSHELRTPLTSIRYLAELLKRGRVKEENKKLMYYETITDEGERLSRLIENILDFSKIEAGMKEYQFKETDVTELTRDVSSRFQEQFAPKGFIIKNEISDRMPRLTVDKGAISQALFNLLDNAVKYSGESSEVILRAWSDREHVFLEVEDKGVGINKEDQKKVFDKFYRSDNIDGEAIKGSGIGLTLVAHIVKAHGGEVPLESDAGKGTKVTLKLPVKRK